jgi:hypothetical protein
MRRSRIPFSYWVSLAELEKKEELGEHMSGRFRDTWGRVPGISHLSKKSFDSSANSTQVVPLRISRKTLLN